MKYRNITVCLRFGGLRFEVCLDEVCLWYQLIPICSTTGKKPLRKKCQVRSSHIESSQVKNLLVLSYHACTTKMRSTTYIQTMTKRQALRLYLVYNIDKTKPYTPRTGERVASTKRKHMQAFPILCAFQHYFLLFLDLMTLP